MGESVPKIWLNPVTDLSWGCENLSQSLSTIVIWRDCLIFTFETFCWNPKLHWGHLSMYNPPVCLSLFGLRMPSSLYQKRTSCILPPFPHITPTPLREISSLAKPRIPLLKPVMLMVMWSLWDFVCVWHAQMFWSQSDNKTIFSRGCPHMGEFTAGELSVCACNMGECEWGVDKHPAASRWWGWEHGKQRKGGEAKENYTEPLLPPVTTGTCTEYCSHTQTDTTENLLWHLHIHRKDSYVI